MIEGKLANLKQESKGIKEDGVKVKSLKTKKTTKTVLNNGARINLTNEKYDKKKAVLLIGGIDPTSGAGLVRDAMMVQKAGCHPLCVPTCFTVQNNSEYRTTQGISFESFEASLSLILKEIANIGAIKIGMVPRLEYAKVIAKFVKQTGLKTIVDMPLISSTGAFLSDIDNINEICELLLHECYLYTPNIIETDMLFGAESIIENGVQNLLIKGGHDSNPEWVDDTLMTLEDRDGDNCKYAKVKLRSARIDTGGMDVRGTGCALASGIAAYIAKGFDLKQSILKAKGLLLTSLKKSYYLGGGAKFLG